MATVSPAANQATNLLQKLTLDSQAKSFEVPETTKRMNTKNPSAIKYGLGGGEVPSGRIPSSERSTTPSIPDFVDPSMCYHPNGYPSTTYYYGGYDGPMNECEEYSRYVNPEGVEIPQTGVYGDNGSLMYHHGYGYAPYGGYPSTGSPVPTIGHDGHLYGPQHYQYPAPYYQPSTPSGTQYVHHQGAIPQAEVSTSVAADQVSLPVGKGSGNVNGNENVNSTNGPLPLRSSYLNSSQASNGSHGKGVFKGGVSVSRHQDPKFGFDGTRSSAPWSDGSILSNGHQRTTTSSSLSSTVPSSRNQNPQSLPHLMGFHPRPAGVSPALGFMSGLYPNNRMYSQSGDLVRTSPGIALDSFDPRTNGRGWLFADKYKPRGRGNGFFSYGNESAEGLNELNRGPRAGRFKNQKGIVPTITLAVKGQSISSNGSNDKHGMVPDRDRYNQAEFPIKYSDAKFFIIKSYSEDDIHRSIKYGVWASTPNGNKKLDVAYREAQEKSSGCPVFLFFSVNTSGQFVGIGEMDGPVDFNKNLEYWQQDKWTGCFPVKWHIVKDVPNNSLKHITLENNDNKPVTNSRDTQEVKFEQGMEMLKIFKDHVHKTSILDDFAFYEARQKTTQERKAKSLQFQKQLLDKKSANASGSERDKDGSTLEPMLQKPLELPSVLNKEAEKDLENQEVFKESGLVVVAGDVNGAKSAVEKRVVDNGITNNVC